MKIKFRIFRKWVKFKKWLSTKTDPREKELSTEQDKAYRIAKKLIVDSNSILYADVSKDRFIIVNGERYIRITPQKIRIIDGSYKYDITYEPRRLERLIGTFAKNLEHRHDKLESEIDARVEKSLDHILNDINNEKELCEKELLESLFSGRNQVEEKQQNGNQLRKKSDK